VSLASVWRRRWQCFGHHLYFLKASSEVVLRSASSGENPRPVDQMMAAFLRRSPSGASLLEVCIGCREQRVYLVVGTGFPRRRTVSMTGDGWGQSRNEDLRRRGSCTSPLESSPSKSELPARADCLWFGMVRRGLCNAARYGEDSEPPACGGSDDDNTDMQP
jgi:hypothetical protein